MGKADQNPKPVLLFCGILFSSEDIFSEARACLAEAWGPVLIESVRMGFRHTEYYREEMGPGLSRVFLAFRDLIPPDSLAGVKVFSNRIEERLAREGKRRVNLDPGYLDAAKVVLASTKDYSHRIYLGGGIFAEVTLRYSLGTYGPLSTTYPDYRERETIAFFNRARACYREKLKHDLAHSGRREG